MSLGTKRVKCLQRPPPGDRRGKIIFQVRPLVSIVSDSDFESQMNTRSKETLSAVSAALHSFGGAAGRAMEKGV